jgi:hypothetical protein
MPSLLSDWSQTTCGLQRSMIGISGSNIGISAGHGRTIELRDAPVRVRGFSAKFPSTRAVVYNTFSVECHLASAQTHRALRAAGIDTRRTAGAAA